MPYKSTFQIGSWQHQKSVQHVFHAHLPKICAQPEASRSIADYAKCAGGAQVTGHCAFGIRYYDRRCGSLPDRTAADSNCRDVGRGAPAAPTRPPLRCVLPGPVKTVAAGTITPSATIADVQVYPNLTASAATIRFSGTAAGQASAYLADMFGNRVLTIMQNERVEVGSSVKHLPRLR